MRRHYNGPRSPFAWVKDAPPELPAWIATAPLPARSRGGAPVRYPLVNDELAVLWMVAAARAALAGESAPSTPAPVTTTPASSNGDARGRFGETLVDPAFVRTAPSIELGPERRELPRGVIQGLAVLVPALALLGFAFGWSSAPEREPAANRAAGGPLELAYSDDWTLTELEPLPGLVLTDSTDLVLDGDHPAELRAGVAPAAEGSLMLPPSFLARLDELPRAETVRLGRVPALRYRGPQHREVDAELTVYVVPTSRGAATIACSAPPVHPNDDAGPGGLARCEDVAATLALRGAQVRRLGPNARYGAAVDAVIERLVRARKPARTALAAAENARRQQRRARTLGAAYRSARAALAGVSPGLVEAPVHRAMVGALDSAAGAYGALSRAARDGDAAAFERAKAKIRGAEDAFRRAVGALGKLGYRIGR